MSQIWKGRPWNYPNTKALYRYAEGERANLTDIHITRLAPGEGAVALDWVYQREKEADIPFEFIIVYGIKGESEKTVVRRDAATSTVQLFDLRDGIDYELTVSAVRLDTRETIGSSPTRLFRPGHVPGTVINYIHPDDYTYGFSGRSPASPSIARLPDGRLVASHDIFWGKAGQNLTKIFRSDDEGRSWTFIADLYPCFWGKLFVHNGSLYMLATSTEYGALLIGRSEDGGETWTEPTMLLAEGSREQGGPHKAPMPVTSYNGRLWTAIDYGSWTLKGHASGVISAPADADLLDAASWTVTPFLAYDADWPGTIEGGRTPSLLEGNVIVTPDNRIVNLLRYQTIGGSPEYGRAIYLNIAAERPGAPLTFGKVIDFHGNMSKFSIYLDKKSGKYWSLVSRVTSDNASQRNLLALVSSDDMETWKVVKDILDYEHNGWSEDNKKVGFQYVDWIFDGDDLLFVSRTAINGAYNYHNANYMTLHRIERFRSI